MFFSAFQAGQWAVVNTCGKDLLYNKVVFVTDNVPIMNNVIYKNKAKSPRNSEL